MTSKSLFDRLIDSMAVLAGVLLVGAVVIESAEVGMRYFLHRPQMWTVEVCEYLLFGITFLGAPWLLREGGHVRVDIVTDRLPRAARHCLGLVSGATGVVVCTTLAWFGLVTALDSYKSGVVGVGTLDIPKFYFILVLALGYSMLLIQFCREFASHLSALRKDT